MLKNTFSEEAMQSIGWRLPLLIGLINILISFWFRAKLPDYKSELDENQYSVGSMYFGFSYLPFLVLSLSTLKIYQLH